MISSSTNSETAFDGPNSDADAKDNVEKVKRAAEAVHAEGMKFKVAPGKPNSTSFFRTGLLDDVAKLVDQFHIQAQSIQDTTSAEYANFTEQITKALRAAYPSIVVTSQISPSQGAQPGGTLQETMRSCILLHGKTATREYQRLRDVDRGRLCCRGKGVLLVV